MSAVPISGSNAFKVTPAQHASLISGSDTVDLASTTRGISFSAVGTLKLTMVGGETLTIPSGSLAAGIIHPLEATRIWSTSTTVSDIVAYW